jgi:hypothetical protein
MSLAVQIVRFVDEHQPGWVECQFVDAAGRCHTFLDKVPIFATADLGPNSTYLHPGLIRCEVLSQSQDMLGRIIVNITTARPDHVESTEGLSDFAVLSDQLSAAAPFVAKE